MMYAGKVAFFQGWSRWVVIGLGIVQLMVTILIIATELGNIASNFWLTNVFAGGWCGVIMIVHIVALFVTISCIRDSRSVLVSIIIAGVALVACAALIAFDAVFLARPTTCILGSQCVSYSDSTSVSTYNFQQNFLTAFNNLGPFRSYSQSQAKYLFQSIQIGMGCLAFVLVLAYLVLYLVIKKQASTKVKPFVRKSVGQESAVQYQQRGRSYPRQTPRVPQAAPGQIPWSAAQKP